MTEQEKIDAKIAAMELLMQRGYITIPEYLTFIRSLKSGAINETSIS
jgi:hypothetical protein